MPPSLKLKPAFRRPCASDIVGAIGCLGDCLYPGHLSQLLVGLRQPLRYATMREGFVVSGRNDTVLVTPGAKSLTAQFAFDRRLHDLRAEFIARENVLRAEFLKETAAIMVEVNDA
jgi:hypothetical protein